MNEQAESTIIFGRMGPAMRLSGRGKSHWNRRAFTWWERMNSAKCAQCGYARLNVRHEIDPDTAPEGPDYYRLYVQDRHPFAESR